MIFTKSVRMLHYFANIMPIFISMTNMHFSLSSIIYHATIQSRVVLIAEQNGNVSKWI